jgi:hypothetical protein
MSTSESNRREKGKPDFLEMTAANIRELKGAEYVEVMFLESARIYKVFQSNSKYEEILKRLREAVNKRHLVRVQLNLPHGDVIEDAESGR